MKKVVKKTVAKKPGKKPVAKKTVIKKAQDGEEGGGLTNKWGYVEGDVGSGMNSFGVAKTNKRLFGGNRTKAIMYDTGFVPGNARILREKTNRKGEIVKQSETPISVNRASRMMRRKGGEYKNGGKMIKAKSGGAVSYKAAAKKVGYKSGGKMKTCKGGC